MDSGERIVLVRDERLPRASMMREDAARALRERIRERGTQRLIVGLDVSDADDDTPFPVFSDNDPRSERVNARLEAVRRTVAEDLGFNRSRRDDFSYQELHDTPFLAINADLAVLARLLSNPLVVSINTEGSGTSFLDMSVPYVGASHAHGLGYSGVGSVAVLDGGVDASHPMFIGKVVAEGCFSTSDSSMDALCANGLLSGSTAPGAGGICDFPAGVTDGSSSGIGCNPGHGSHVAGIAVGNSVNPGMQLSGVAPGTDLISVQVKSLSGSPASATFEYKEADVVSALSWVNQIRHAQSIVAVNMSFGLSSDNRAWTFSSCDGDWPGVSYIANQLKNNGVMVIAAAGNEQHLPGFANRISPPACISSVVSVSATMLNPVSMVESMPDYANRSANQSMLDLLALGGDRNDIDSDPHCGWPHAFLNAIQSAYPTAGCQYVQMPGTSQAAPHVAGAAAILQQRYPGASPEAMRDFLRGTGVLVPLGGNAGNAPRIDLQAAMTAPPAPAMPAQLNVDWGYCHGLHFLAWPASSGSVTEYQVQRAHSSSFAWATLETVTQGQNYMVNVAQETWYRVRACNTVACSGWRNGSSSAQPSSVCL